MNFSRFDFEDRTRVILRVDQNLAKIQKIF